MNEISNMYNKSFNIIKISIASPKHIRMWSFGEVKKSDTINYRTTKPENDGLFCARIFGPIKDYECNCGRYKKIKHRGTICEKCGVEITVSRVRRERMGHIELSCPIVHTWFLRSLPSKISIILGVPLKKLEKVLSYSSYIVINPGLTGFLYRELISEEEYLRVVNLYGNDHFRAQGGADAIEDMLANINLNKEQIKLRSELEKSTSESNKDKIIRRLEIIENFIKSGNKADWMILKVLPIIPPDLRPLVMLDGGKFATSDLNELYRRIINRNNRLRKLIHMKAPEIIIKNEKRMLQESVDSLFNNTNKNSFAKSTNRRPLKSLTDMLKGKHGRFRQNLLGKRVDYSGRSVIVAGSNMRLNQCGLPKKMVLELMKPFVYSKLEWYGVASSVKSAKKIVENFDFKIWCVLKEITKYYPMILNRAPTLHRLGMQSFNVILINEKSIKLHPLVCSAFNADFDGDQMAVHVPLSVESQLESKILMISNSNTLSPANGNPISLPSKDMIAGIYYLSLSFDSGKYYILYNLNDIFTLLHKNEILVHDKIICSFFNSYDFLVTTLGRLLILEEICKYSLSIFYCINKSITKSDISFLIDIYFRDLDPEITSKLNNNLMNTGFNYMCKSGLSISREDLTICNKKKYFVGNTLELIKRFCEQYLDGLITDEEKYNKTVNEWARCSDNIVGDLMKNVSSLDSNKKIINDFNSIFIMFKSGARGSISQIRQLSGIKGIITKPSGEIIVNPITSSLKNGLNELEYFLSIHGSRKGLADTALKTANSGYLTRKLVDVAQDYVVVEKNCLTNKYIIINISVQSSISLENHILGRTLAEDIIVENTNIVIACKGSMISKDLITYIKKSNILSIKIRSILTCDTKYGSCIKCYGSDLSNGLEVNLGEAVGIIAAQSIGEPGTQLTMRTFHVGGSVSQRISDSNIKSLYSGNIKLFNFNTFLIDSCSMINTSKNLKLEIVKDRHGILQSKIQCGAKIYLLNNSLIKRKKKAVDWNPFVVLISSEIKGYVIFEDFVENKSIKRIYDSITGLFNLIIIDNGNELLKPAIIIKNSYNTLKYYISIGSFINVKEFQLINAGELIAKVSRKFSKNRDITGGLSKIIDLLEVRHTKSNAILSGIDGVITYGRNYKSKRKLIVISECKKYKREYFFSYDHHITVNEGDYVFKGDILLEGYHSLQDILNIRGLKKFIDYMIDKIQDIYILQGVKINNKHLEVILKQMLKKIRIISPGDTAFMYNEMVDSEIFHKINKDILKKGGKIAKGKIILQGITKASLQTYSFLSAASFQETIKVLTSAAILGKVDYLRGIKENVITGRLIPAGTGFFIRKLQQYKKVCI